MSGRYEIYDDGSMTIALTLGVNTLFLDALEDDFAVGAIRQLLVDLAAVSAERDLLAREISEADDLARHFVRDRPTLRARGAIVLQADEIAKLRAQLAEYENAQTVAYLATPVSGDYAGYHGDSVGMTPGSAIMDAKSRFYAEFSAVELIARPKVKP